jgi:hypothetical protein
MVVEPSGRGMPPIHHPTSTGPRPRSLFSPRGYGRHITEGDVYEQLSSPFGDFGESIANASTKAVSSGSVADDSTYTSIEGSIASLTSRRDTLAAKIKQGLNAAAFEKKALNEQEAKGWIEQAHRLIDQAARLAGSS